MDVSLDRVYHETGCLNCSVAHISNTLVVGRSIFEVEAAGLMVGNISIAVFSSLSKQQLIVMSIIGLSSELFRNIIGIVFPYYHIS